MSVELLVEAGRHDRDLCPVKVSVEAAKLGAEWKALKVCTLVEADTEAKIPGQCEVSADGETITISWILDSLKAENRKNLNQRLRCCSIVSKISRWSASFARSLAVLWSMSTRRVFAPASSNRTTASH